MILLLKRNTFILLVLLCIGTSNAQRHDNVWLFGYSSSPDSTFGGSVLEFNEDTINSYYQDRDMNFSQTNTSMSDTSGNLLFYTNGIYIANTEHDTMQNGDGINPGEYADDHAYYGYILSQGTLAIPKPESENLYYLFHTSLDYPNNQISFHSPLFYYSLIDMSLDNGLGAVIQKNQIIIDDILTLGRVTATKHANGRDWWILLRKYAANKYYRILVTPDGVVNHGIQEIGVPFSDGVGQAVFSPNGRKYVVYNGNFIDEGGLLNIYDFDRCSGDLSNPIQTSMVDSAYSLGAAVSPNSRYLYLSSYNYIYQYDLEADDVLASKDTVAIYDGYEVEITPTIGAPTRFKYMQLAPDGKIYINIPGAVNVLHVINQPNEAGDACEVAQHSIPLPTFNAHSLPHFPNYRLGADTESLCDTITSVEAPTTTHKHNSIKIFPNPTNEVLNLDFDQIIDSDFVFEIYDVSGKLMTSFELAQGLRQYSIRLSDLQEGIYFYACKLGNQSFNGKIVLMK